MSQPAPQARRSGGAAGCLAGLLALILVAALPLGLLLLDVYRVLFNPPLMKRVLLDEVVRSDLIPAALEWFSDRRAQQRVDQGQALTGQSEPDVVLLLSYLDRADWSYIKAEVLPNEVLAAWVNASVDGVYAWIDSAERTPQITWDLVAFKQLIASEHGVNAIQRAYDQLPDCQPAQIDDFQARQAAAPKGQEVLYNLCRFPAPWFEDQVNDYRNSVLTVVENLPDQFALTQELANASNLEARGSGPEAVKQQLRQVRALARWAWIVPLLLIVLILLLKVRTAETAGRWLGLPGLVAGTLALLPALAYSRLVTRFLAALPLSEVPELVQQEAGRMVLRLAREIFQPLLVQASVVLVIAALAVLVMGLAARRR